MPSEIEKYKSFIDDDITCSLHVRRGDYLKKENASLNVCGIDYFIKAINYIMYAAFGVF